MRGNRRGIATIVALVLLFATFVVLGRRAPRHGDDAPSAPALVTAAPEALFDVPPAGEPLDWHAWSDSAFALARAQAKPVVVLLDAVWSECAQLYAATLASHPAARAALESEVVAVRVGIDRRPDVHMRYHTTFDTLPTLVFLTPGGVVWDVRDAMPPSTLVESIRDLAGADATVRDTEMALLTRAYSVAPLDEASPVEDATPWEQRGVEIAAALAEAWPHPEEFLEPDTPILAWNALGFLRAHAEATDSHAARALFLQGLRQLLASSLLREGAFWRDVEADEERVSRAAFLDTQALLLEHFETAAQWTGDAVYRDAARGLHDFLRETLWDERHGLFRGAQGTLVVDEAGWPLLTGAELTRMRGHRSAIQPGPWVAPVYPAGANARAAEALLHAGVAPDVAHRVLEALWTAYETRGVLPHDFDVGTRGRLRAARHDFAVDYADAGSAFLVAASLAADPNDSHRWTQRAAALGELLLDVFHDGERGLFRDARPAAATAPARMRIELTPLVDNARVARFLRALTTHTGDPRPADAADAALQAWNTVLWSRSVWEACEFGLAAQP